MVEVEETTKKKLSRFLHLFALVISYGLERSSSSERSLLKRSSSSWSSSTLNNITECEYWVPRERKRRDHNVFYIATKKCCALTIGPSIHPSSLLPVFRPSLYTRGYVFGGWTDPEKVVARDERQWQQNSTKYNPMPIVSRPLLRLRPLIPRRTRKMDAHDSRIISYRSSNGDCEVCERHNSV